VVKKIKGNFCVIPEKKKGTERLFTRESLTLEGEREGRIHRGRTHESEKEAKQLTRRKKDKRLYQIKLHRKTW